MSFVETPRFPEEISQGSSFGPAFMTKISATLSGFEDRRPKWTEQRCEGVVLMENASITEFEEMLDWLYAMRGAAYAFRYKDWGDYRSSRGDTAVAFDDQVIGTGDGSTASFQLVKKYTKGLTYTRDIKKPVSGTVVVGIGGAEQSGNFTVDTATGIVTFDDITKAVTDAFSSGASTSIDATNHGLVTGDTVYLSTFTGDWAGLNGARYTATVLTANRFTVVHDSSGYAAYSGNGGQLDTIPQSGETVTAGFEFDVPVRFDTDRMDTAFIDYKAFTFQLPIVEIKL